MSELNMDKFDMGWYIVNSEEDTLLMWDEKVIYFDSEKEANEFRSVLSKKMREVSMVCQRIVFNDGGYISCKEVLKLMEEEYGTPEVH